MFRIRMLLALLVVFALTACGGSASLLTDKQVSKVKPLPINSKPLGKSYGEWAAVFWQWDASIPCDPVTGAEHPGEDTTGEWTAQWQSGNMWILEGTSGNDPDEPVERTLTVPPGKFLLVNLLTGLNCYFGRQDDGPPYSEEQLREELTDFVDTFDELHATLDGRELADDLFQFRAASPGAFAMQLPDNINNIWRHLGYDIVGADWDSLTVEPCVSDGYWLILPPLSAGQHELAFGGSCTTYGFNSSVIYHLTVEN